MCVWVCVYQTQNNKGSSHFVPSSTMSAKLILLREAASYFSLEKVGMGHKLSTDISRYSVRGGSDAKVLFPNWFLICQ